MLHRGSHGEACSFCVQFIHLLCRLRFALNCGAAGQRRRRRLQREVKAIVAYYSSWWPWASKKGDLGSLGSLRSEAPGRIRPLPPSIPAPGGSFGCPISWGAGKTFIETTEQPYELSGRLLQVFVYVLRNFTVELENIKPIIIDPLLY